MDISSFEREVMQFAVGIADEYIDFKDEVDGDDAEQARWDFVFSHLFHLISLGEEVLHLHKTDFSRTACLGARSMLESFFQIAATKAKPDFALEKRVYDWVEYLKKFRNQGDQEGVEFLQGQIDEMKRVFNVTPPKRLRVVDICELGGVEQIYREEYATLSAKAHVTMEGLIAHEGNMGNAITLKSALGALISGASFAVSSIPTRTPNEHVARGKKLADTFLEWIDKGAFVDSDSSSVDTLDNPTIPDPS